MAVRPQCIDRQVHGLVVLAPPLTSVDGAGSAGLTEVGRQKSVVRRWLAPPEPPDFRLLTSDFRSPVASILLQTEETLTLAVGSRLTLYEQNDLWGDFAAAEVLSGLPITVVFLVAQRWLVSGLTAGAVKG